MACCSGKKKKSKKSTIESKYQKSSRHVSAELLEQRASLLDNIDRTLKVISNSEQHLAAKLLIPADHEQEMFDFSHFDFEHADNKSENFDIKSLSEISFKMDHDIGLENRHSSP